MRRFRLKHLSPLLALALFCFALLVMNRALGEGSYRDILDHLSALPPQRLLLAVALTILSYLVLTFYDHLAINYLGRSLGKLRTSVASFISYSFSRNIGFTFLTGGSIRYRFYSSWGLTGEEVTRLVAFAAGGFALGLLTVGGGVAMAPVSIPAAEDLPLEVLRPAGALAIALVIAYLGMISFRSRPFRIRGWSIPLPAPRHAAGQILLGSLDWLLTAIVLYTLLSGIAPISLPEYLQIYLLAQLTAIISHVPGGLGVFETVILLLVPDMPRSELMGILLAYRAIYYLLPFGVAIVLLGGMEGAQHRKALRRAGSWMGGWLSSIAPSVMSGAVLVCAALLLFTSVLPPSNSRGLLPWASSDLLVWNLLGFLSGGIGVGLLLMARGVQRRLAVTYRPALLLLGAGVLISLPQVQNGWVPLTLAAVLLLLFLGRSHFDRAFPFLEETFPPGWIALLLIVLTASTGLLLFSHPEMTRDSAGNAMIPPLWTASGALLVLVLFWGGRASRGRISESEPASPRNTQTAEALVARQRCTTPGTILTGEFSQLFDRRRDAVLMYGRQGRSWIALGDPVGDEGQRREVAWRFLERCEGQNGVCVFFDVGAQPPPDYLEMGLVLQPAGDEAVVPLAKETGEPAEEDGFSLEILPPENVSTDPAIDRILAELGRDPKGSLPWMERNPLALVRREGEPVAFSVLCRGGDGHELGVGPLYSLTGESFSCFEFLVRSLRIQGAKEGYSGLNLGLVPLKGWKEDPFADLWEAFAPRLFRHGAHFGNPGEFRRWVEGQNPSFRRRYIAFPGGMDFPQILSDIAALNFASRHVKGEKRSFFSLN